LARRANQVVRKQLPHLLSWPRNVLVSDGGTDGTGSTACKILRGVRHICLPRAETQSIAHQVKPKASSWLDSGVPWPKSLHLILDSVHQGRSQIQSTQIFAVTMAKYRLICPGQANGLERPFPFTFAGVKLVKTPLLVKLATTTTVRK
jgi:hypothetical protein